ncbi:MAG: DUF2141 domain-containing protein [Bacteroidales bacterium]|nr:DUF2141 domain-containing protein [Bacteroidales bacterium]
MKTYFILFFILSQSLIAVSQCTCIHVTVHNIRNNDGIVRYSLYGEKNKYADYEDTYLIGTAKVKKGSINFSICDIPDGIYGLCLLHDEDNNGDMTYNGIGFPLEGYGFSNDAKVYLSPPKFKAAKFEKKGNTSIRVKMRYML